MCPKRALTAFLPKGQGPKKEGKMAKIRLSAKRVEKLTTERQQEDFWDELTPGLHLRVSGTTNRKTWLVRYRSNGAHRRVKLGAYHPEPNPDLGLLGLADARALAREHIAAAEGGQDLAREREEARQEEEVLKQESTFRAMAEEVLKARARKTRERTQKERRRILDKELLPRWGDREAASITRRDVVLLVEKIEERGAPVLANRALAVVRLIFNDAIRRGFADLESNPAHLVEAPGVEEGRDRHLTRDEIRAVWEATREESPLTRAIFRLALLTAQRIGSVCAMRWDGIEENGGGVVWRIPAEDFKGGRPHLVPLSPEALQVIQELREVRVSEDHLFPARAGTKTGHITNVSGALARIRKRSKLEHWTAHDFRTTFRTHATLAKEDGGLGVAPHHADAVLGHAEGSLGWSRYQGDRERYLLSEKREALRAWGTLITAAVEVER